MVVRVTRGGAAARHGAHSTSTSASHRERAGDGPRQRALPAGNAAPLAGSSRVHRARVARNRTASASSISRRASAASGSRRIRSFSRQRRSSRRIGGRRVGTAAAPVRVGADDGRDRVGHIVAAERPHAGEHFVEHAPERPDVGALVDGLPARLLRAHVRGRAEDHAGRRHRRGLVIVGDLRAPRPRTTTTADPSLSRGRSRAPSPCRRRAP